MSLISTAPCCQFSYAFSTLGGRQFLEELRRDQAVDTAHELAQQVVLDVAQHLGTLRLDVGGVDVEREVDGLRRDVELVEEVDQRRAIGIQDHAL
jgi:hypothetical protein